MINSWIFDAIKKLQKVGTSRNIRQIAPDFFNYGAKDRVARVLAIVVSFFYAGPMSLENNRRVSAHSNVRTIPCADRRTNCESVSPPIWQRAKTMIFWYIEHWKRDREGAGHWNYLNAAYRWVAGKHLALECYRGIKRVSRNEFFCSETVRPGLWYWFQRGGLIVSWTTEG